MYRTLVSIGDDNAKMLPAPMNLVVLQRDALIAGRALLCDVVRIWFEHRRILAREDCNHARRRFCGRDVDVSEASVGDRALKQCAVSKPRTFQLGREFRRTDDFIFSVNSSKRLTKSRHAHHAIAATVANARTIARFASSILK